MAERIDIKKLQNQMSVLAAIQLKQSEILKNEAEEIAAIRERLHLQDQEIRQQGELMRQQNAGMQQRMAEWDARIEKLVSGFGEFLRRNPA